VCDAVDFIRPRFAAYLSSNPTMPLHAYTSSARNLELLKINIQNTLFEYSFAFSDI
jgi:predicted xylose isomerase-like sugar epimerase